MRASHVLRGRSAQQSHPRGNGLRRHRRPRTSLYLEALEPRRLLAGDVELRLDDGSLLINGTPGEDQIEIVDFGNGGVEVIVCNERCESHNFRGVREAIVHAGDGDDSVAYRTAFRSGQPVQVEVHGEAGADTLTGHLSASVIHVGKNWTFELTGGAGDDTLRYEPTGVEFQDNWREQPDTGEPRLAIRLNEGAGNGSVDVLYRDVVVGVRQLLEVRGGDGDEPMHVEFDRVELNADTETILDAGRGPSTEIAGCLAWVVLDNEVSDADPAPKHDIKLLGSGSFDATIDHSSINRDDATRTRYEIAADLDAGSEFGMDVSGAPEVGLDLSLGDAVSAQSRAAGTKKWLPSAFRFEIGSLDDGNGRDDGAPGDRFKIDIAGYRDVRNEVTTGDGNDVVEVDVVGPDREPDDPLSSVDNRFDLGDGNDTLRVDSANFNIEVFGLDAGPGNDVVNYFDPVAQSSRTVTILANDDPNKPAQLGPGNDTFVGVIDLSAPADTDLLLDGRIAGGVEGGDGQDTIELLIKGDSSRGNSTTFRGPIDLRLAGGGEADDLSLAVSDLTLAGRTELTLNEGPGDGSVNVHYTDVTVGPQQLDILGDEGGAAIHVQYDRVAPSADTTTTIDFGRGGTTAIDECLAWTILDDEVMDNTTQTIRFRGRDMAGDVDVQLNHRSSTDRDPTRGVEEEQNLTNYLVVADFMDSDVDFDVKTAGLPSAEVSFAARAEHSSREDSLEIFGWSHEVRSPRDAAPSANDIGDAQTQFHANTVDRSLSLETTGYDEVEADFEIGSEGEMPGRQQEPVDVRLAIQTPDPAKSREIVVVGSKVKDVVRPASDQVNPPGFGTFTVHHRTTRNGGMEASLEFAGLEVAPGSSLQAQVHGTEEADDIQLAMDSVVIGPRATLVNEVFGLAGDDQLNTRWRNVDVFGEMTSSVHGGRGGDRISLVAESIYVARGGTLVANLLGGPGNDLIEFSFSDLLVEGTFRLHVDSGSGDDDRIRGVLGEPTGRAGADLPLVSASPRRVEVRPEGANGPLEVVLDPLAVDRLVVELFGDRDELDLLGQVAVHQKGGGHWVSVPVTVRRP